VMTCMVVLGVAAGCSPPPTEEPIPVVNVYATSAARPWLDAFYSCAPPATAIRLSDPVSADVVVRLGEPPGPLLHAFQIGEEGMLVVVHPLDAVGALSSLQVQGIFAGELKDWRDLGGADMPIEVWTYSPGEDIQSYFDQVVMDERPITSLARLAVSAQAMSDAVGATPGAIGFLPQRWKTGNTREVLHLPNLPVLAITKTEPTGVARQVLGCVQSGSGPSQ
jgi:PBP superfamily domain